MTAGHHEWEGDTMLWLHAYLLLAPFSPPPCQAGDLDRFPRPIHVWAVTHYDESSECSSRTCPMIKQRLNWLSLQRDMQLGRPACWEEWSEQIAEQERLEEVWGLLADVWDARERYSMLDETIGHRLQALRDVIGEEAYLAGRMPPPVPLHRYHSIDP